MSSSNNNFMSKEFWKSRRGQRIFCIGGLVLSVIFLLVQFGGNIGSLFPSASSKEVMEREIKKLQQDQLKLKAELAVIDAVKQIADKRMEGIWNQSVNGVPEVELRSLIENAAKTLELRLNNISTVRKTNFNKDLSLLEVDVALTTDIDTLTKFLLAVDKIEPKLYWRRFDCRNSFMFGMPAVQFNGTLRCGNDERPEARRVPNGAAPENGSGKEKPEAGKSADGKEKTEK